VDYDIETVCMQNVDVWQKEEGGKREESGSKISSLNNFAYAALIETE
jgi:hypothetical protein